MARLRGSEYSYQMQLKVIFRPNGLRHVLLRPDDPSNRDLVSVINKWDGRLIEIGTPISVLLARWNTSICNTDILWPVTEPELIKDIWSCANGKGITPYVCRHMIEIGD
jgi:hypothetical protein